MFETQKIDTFFSGEKNLLDKQEKIFMTRRMKVVRFFKLFLPCLTALLLGVGIVLFDFETHGDSTLSLAEEEKLYFEKFRMKNTVFEITEKDNQFSVLKADIVEEATAGSKLYDLINPRAQTLDKGKIITLNAQTGLYNQNTQVLDLKTNVVANYNNEMEITTNSGSYDFTKEMGYGNEQIIGKGDKGYFKADRFTFDKKKNIATLINHVYMKSGDMELRSPNKAMMYLNQNKFVTTNAVVNKGKDILKGDKLTAYFKDTKTFVIDKAYSEGHTEIYSENKKAFANKGEYDANNRVVKLFQNVKIVDNTGYTATADFGVYDIATKTFTLKQNVVVKNKDGYTAVADTGVYDMNKNTFTLNNHVRIDKGSNTITSSRAIYYQNSDEFRFYDNIAITQESGTATAKSGVYYIKKNIAELEHDVVLTKDGNTVRGEKAISDFNTSKSRLIGKEGGRIFGKLIEGTFKRKKEN